MASLRTSLRIIKASLLVTTRTSHIPKLDSRTPHIEGGMVASAGVATTAPIGASQVLAGVLLSAALVDVVEALHLPNSRISHGHQRLEHEAAAPPPKRPVHSLSLHPKPPATLLLSMPTTTPSVPQRTSE